ncbi:MAG: hypothetical protein Q9166_000654 [cf. Caloplaca sp. 2 TL-2023]
MLESWEREGLLSRLRSGEINEEQFTEQVYHFACIGLTRRMQLHVPDLPSPDPNDLDGHLSNVFKFINNTSSKDSDYHRVLMRAENAQELVDDIFDNWTKLRAIANAHFEALARRWIKKRTIPKRKYLLGEIWPGMNKRHRPDFEVIRRDLKGSSHRDALMMPYINLEDLSSEKNLLHLIKSRTQVYPEHFAWSDGLPFKAAVTMGAVKDAAQYDKVMLLTGEKSRSSYGKLREIGLADVENIIWTGYGYQLGHGIVILEIQQRLYRFLLQCVESLLYDIDLGTAIIDGKTVDLQEYGSLPSTMTSPESVEWQSVSKMNMQASYHLPQPFSLEALLRLAVAQRDAAEDAFWALHEDPGYFQEQVELKFQQSLEPCRRLYSTFHKVQEAASKQVGIYIVHDVCRDVILWEAVENDLRELKALKAGLNTEIQLSERLPLEYERALESFVALIFLAWRYAVTGLCRAITASRNFIDYLEMVPAEQGRYMDFHLKDLKENHPILNLLADLGTEKSNMLGALNILDEMERIVDTDMVQRAMIDTEMAREISKLAALAQIHDALVQHQPTIQVTQDSGPLMHHHKKRLKAIDDLNEYLTGTSLGPYMKPRSAFAYPVEKKRTLQQVEQMRQAEAKLDTFWEQVDKKKLMSCTGKTLLQWMGNRLTTRNIYRTQPWQPDTEKVIGSAPPKIIFQPFPDSSSTTIKELVPELRKKSKTKGQTSLTTEPTQPATVPQDTKQTIPTFSLPNKVYKTMSAFFPTSTQDRTSRKIPWKDFLHAMYSLRFQIQKRHGSEWYFEPSWNRSAPITIHEPHPSHEMRFDKIRFEANRMARKYSWSNATFVQAG